MMELSFFLQLCVLFFAVLGYLRGFHREFISLIGILLGLFFLTEFGWLIDLAIGGSSATNRFMVDAVILIVHTFLAYEQAPTSFAPRAYRTKSGSVKYPNPSWQMNILGGVLGGFNGYLVVGSLWYLMDQFEYPLEPLFMQPLLGTGSAEFVSRLPLVWLQQGNMLIWLVAGLFMLIIIFR